MKSFSIPKLKEVVSWIEDHLKPKAIVDSPEAAALAAAREAAKKLDVAEKTGAAAASSEALASVSAAIRGGMGNPNFSQQKYLAAAQGAIAEELATENALLRASGAALMPDHETLKEIISVTATEPKNLTDARDQLRVANGAAKKLLNLPSAKSSSVSTASVVSAAGELADAKAKLVRYDAIFAAAGLNAGQALFYNDNGYLKRAMSRTTTPTAAVAAAPLSRLDAIPLPPTDEEVLQKYEQLSALADPKDASGKRTCPRDAQASERRQKFYSENAGAITRALGQRRTADREQRAAQRAREQLDASKAHEAAQLAAQQELAASDAEILHRFEAMAPGGTHLLFAQENQAAIARARARLR